MKNTFYILIALILLMVACGQPSGNAPLSAELQRAEDLMYPHPDSALHILQAMTPPEDELNRATWALLLTQAKYKCDIEIWHDHLNEAYEFFHAKHDMQQRALAAYHQGIYYRLHKKEMEKALEFYMEAKEAVEQSSDYNLGHLINIHISFIYVYQKLYKYAEDYCLKAKEYALLSCDDYYISHSFLNLARIYSVQKDYQKSIDYYNKALDIAKQIKNKKNRDLLVSTELTELSNIYAYQQEYDKSLSAIREAMQIDSTKQQLLVVGNLYYKMNQRDSAYYYLEQAVKSDNIYTVKTAYQVLYALSKKSKDYERFVDYSSKLRTVTDSIYKLANNKALIEMQEKYNQQRVKDEMAAKMTLQKQRILMGIGVAILILCFIAYRIRIRNKERITRLAEAEERIETLNHLLEEAQKEPSPDAGQDDTFFKRILLQQLGIIRLVANTPTAQNPALLRRLAETGNDEMPAEELIAWKDLYPIIDRLYHGFYTRLTQHFGSVLTDKEVQTCCLLCAGFSTKEIAVITRQASSTVYFRKTSARQKMGAPDGADIVEWVKELE